MRTAAAAVVVAAMCGALLPGCSGAADRAGTEPAPTRTGPTARPDSRSPRSTPQPSPTGPPVQRFDSWVVGARPLPLRADGFGRVLRTPRELRERRIRTVDLLPPPRSNRFFASVVPVTEGFARRTRLAWQPGCPVALHDLSLVRMPFWGFDDRPHTGRLVVRSTVAADLVSVFRELYAHRFPIEQMRLVTLADLDAPPSGDGNNTAAYACRAARGSTVWSAHAFGLAVDVNPFMNPYRNGDLVLPELSGAYLDRSWERPGMILPGGVVARAFARIGWTWGGTFRSLKDYQHFSATGR